VDWVRVADRSEVRPGSARPVDVAGRRLALFNMQGHIVALDDRCPGDGQPLSNGRQVDGGRTVECEADGCRVDLDTGHCLTAGGRDVRRYDVRVAGDGDEVEVRV
jgi:nitrite reductase/ring-hydroxylating ferredoxin subunit